MKILDRPGMISRVCCLVGMSRQNYYRKDKQRQREELEKARILELVQAERQLQPRLGGRKVLNRIRPQLKTEGIELGRDRFFDLLREENLLIPRKRKPIKTTDSRHCEPVYPNLLKDCELTGVHQAWVSDITYLQTLESTLFLSLITDAFSRKIVGWCLSPHLDTRGCIQALKKALGQLPAGATPVHHSDRGCQYASRAYTQILKDHDCRISMTEENHCYENAKAERVNGILKQEYGLKQKWNTQAQMKKGVEQAIWLYNEKRPHMSLGYRTPQQVHSQMTWEKTGALPPNPQDLSLRTKPVTSSQKQNPEDSENRNDYRLRLPDARVASQHCPILPVTENIVEAKGNF